MLTITLIGFTLLASLLVFSMKNKKGFSIIALFASIVTLLLSIYAFVNFDKTSASNYAIDIPWMSSLGIHLSFAMDGISLLLVMLTTVVTPIILFSTFRKENSYSSVFYGLVLLMEAALIGVFTTRDGFVFYLFWEMALIPIYFICALWGGENRIKITLKFFIYTMFGSLFMLAALIWLYLQTPTPHTFDIYTITHYPICPCVRYIIFGAFFLAFAIKIPIFPFHSWQPSTYTVAPTAGSMLLAGIMLKMGLYGMIRFNIPIAGDLIFQYSKYVIPLAVIGLLYGSIIAIKQKEIKRFIAYSSFAHVGLMAAAILTLTSDSLQGSIYQMLSHGINVVALFFVAEIIFRRAKTTQIADLGGIAKQAPMFAIFFMVTMLGAVALPLTSGFIGEFLMLVGMAQYNIFLSAIAGISIILGAVYMFWLYQRSMYGEVKPATENFYDLDRNELIIAIPLVVIIILMGVYPTPLFEIIKPAVDLIIND